MNLAAYDKINDLSDKDYIQVSYKRLLSSTIEYYDKYCLLKRYNKKHDTYNYYVAVFNDKQEGLKHKFLRKDNTGRVIIYLTEIWNELPDYIKEKDCNIDIELVESQSDGKVYKLFV